MKIENERLIIEEAIKYGQKWSLLFHTFSLWLLNKAQALNVDTVYFFTREGSFFYDIANILTKRSNIQTPELKILEVSRASTFLPSINFQTKNPFQRLWNIYPNQSAQGFFNSIGMNDPALKDLFEESNSHKYNEVIHNIGRDSNFQMLIRREDIVTRINTTLHYNKALLTQYLEQEGFFSAGKKAIVDIGWRGSIQDNLSLLFPKEKIHGLYLGLHAFREKTLSSNEHKDAFLFNANVKKHRIFSSLMRFVLPLEILCTPPHMSSVTNYVLQKNQIIPVVHFSTIKGALIDRIIESFQQSVLNNIDQWQQYLPSYSINMCRQIAKQIVWHPKDFLVYVYRNNLFNETFGQGEIIRLYKPSKTVRSVFSNMKRSGWIGGYLYKKIPSCLFCLLPLFYCLYCLLTFDSYLIHRR